MEIVTINKTTELIGRAHDRNVLIVVYSESEVDRVAKYAKALDKNIFRPISFNTFLMNKYSSRYIEEFLIDDLDSCIQSLSRVPIFAVSMTTPLVRC